MNNNIFLIFKNEISLIFYFVFTFRSYLNMLCSICIRKFWKPKDYLRIVLLLYFDMICIKNCLIFFQNYPFCYFFLDFLSVLYFSNKLHFYSWTFYYPLNHSVSIYILMSKIPGQFTRLLWHFKRQSLL